MAKKSKDNKNIIIGVCSAIVVVIVVTIAIILATGGNGKIDDSYFVSDDTKYVLTIDSEDVPADDEEEQQYTPLKTHLVYTYSGDEITGLTAYYEYADDASAKAAVDYIKSSDEESYKEVTTNGKYIVAVVNESEYQEMTASDVKQQVEFMEMLKNMDTEGGETVEPEEGTIESEEATPEETE